MVKSLHRIGWLTLSLAVVVGCDSVKSMFGSKPTTQSAVKTDAAQPAAELTKKIAIAKVGPSKAAATMPSNSDVAGTVTFTEFGGKMYIVADISGFAPNTKHGFHIHEKGDLTAPDLSSAGGHYDPEMTKHHGAPNEAMGVMDMKLMSHAGDLGNLVADDKGAAHLELTVSDLTIDGPKNAILGRSVIIHAKADDFMTQPTGNSGGRVAGGVIERTSQQ
jgi:Cu-Zn family superoxide dismutase